MKKFEDYREDIYKCSKCGLCQSVCPVYKELGNDCAVSRGKFIMLRGVLNGELKLNKNISKYLDMCTKCGKCSEFCPSEIDVVGIFTAAKYKYMLENPFGKIERLVHKPMVALNSLKHKSKTSKSAKVAYFKGCVSALIPKCVNSTLKILKAMDVEILPIDFDCCGMPFYSSGDLEQFEKQKLKNIEKLPKNVDYILTDCASCESTLRMYGENVSSKLKNVYELIAESDLKFSFKRETSFTFHKPCHLKDIEFLPKILEKCENLEYIEMIDFDDCCGFAGEFSIKNPKLSLKLIQKKAKNARNAGVQYVTTACPSCQMGLLAGGVKSVNLVELLEKGLL